jgi:hypothetical protein
VGYVSCAMWLLQPCRFDEYMEMELDGFNSLKFTCGLHMSKSSTSNPCAPGLSSSFLDRLRA